MMKITKRQLRRIIKEELQLALRETDYPESGSAKSEIESWAKKHCEKSVKKNLRGGMRDKMIDDCVASKIATWKKRNA